MLRVFVIYNGNIIGHTSWTGILTIITLVNNMSVILLTNRKDSPVVDNIENPNDFFTVGINSRSNTET